MPLYLFYTMVQKSQKWPKTQIKGGSCLKLSETLKSVAKDVLEMFEEVYQGGGGEQSPGCDRF